MLYSSIFVVLSNGNLVCSFDSYKRAYEYIHMKFPEIEYVGDIEKTPMGEILCDYFLVKRTKGYLKIEIKPVKFYK